MTTFVVPTSAWGATQPSPEWNVAGTRWASSTSLSDAQIDRFHEIWTARFLDDAGLQAYLDRPGLYDDGYNDLSEEDKAALVVSLIQYWQETLPGFGRDFWTGDAEHDQAQFEQLAMMMYATIFAKDAFLSSLRESAAPAAMGPPAPEDLDVDAGIAEFPGMSQADITAYFEELHVASRVITARPEAPAEGTAPTRPAAAELVLPGGDVSIPEPSPPSFLDSLRGLIPAMNVVPATTPEGLLAFVDAGTYLACGQLAGRPTVCAPLAVPIGTPVMLDLDQNALTGTAGAEVLVDLTLTVNPAYAVGGAAASLSVRRVDLLSGAPLPAEVHVVYRIAPAQTQVLAGFDGRTTTLGETQEVMVTLKDVAAALANNVQLRTDLTYTGATNPRFAVLAGYSALNINSFPPTPYNPSVGSITFEPMPSSLSLDLKFDQSSTTQSVVEGTVHATTSPKVTAFITMDKGSTHREMTGVIDRLPTDITFRAVSEAVGATALNYAASSGFDRFAFSDVLTPNTAQPAVRKVLFADVRGVPSSISFTITRPFQVEYTASARVASATVIVESYDASGLAQSVGAAVTGLPSQWTITGDDDPLSIRYTANGLIDLVSASFYDRVKRISAAGTVDDIPGTLTVDVSSGQTRVSASPPIKQISATFSKNGAVPVVLGGNHLSVVYAQAASSANDVIGASFAMSQVSLADYHRVGNLNTFDLRMGGGAPFTAYADATFSSGEKAYVYATLSPLPTSVQASIGERTTITTSQNFDLYAYGQYGTAAAIAATPAPYYLHGASVRDGASGTARAIKAQLWLTGLPTSVTIDSRANTFSFTNWKPSVSYFALDAELDNFVSPALNAYAQLSSLPSTLSLSYAMSTTDITGGKRTRVDFTTSAPLGQLYGDMIYGTNHGRLVVSNIPDDIHATYTLLNGLSTFTWDATSAISSIYAGFRVITQSSSFQGYVSMTDIPSDFTLNVGRASGGQGPTLSYSATASTLDVSAYTDSSLFGGDLKARLSFGLTNLGAATNVYVSGNSLRFTSSPATGNIYANVWATYNYYQAGSGIWDEGGFVEFPWAYHVGVTPTVNNLAVTLSSFSDFTLAWGVTTKMSGSYGAFSFGWSSFTVNLHAYGKIQIVVDWPWPFGSSTINIVNLHYHPPTFNVDVLFQKYTNHQGYWFGTSGWAICDWSLWMDVRPHPHGAAWNSVSTSAATAEGGAWYVTPNPWGALPSWGIDLAARYTSPDGGSIGGPHFGYDCW